MGNPSEIEDSFFGKLSLISDSVYFAQVPWNREIQIRLFIHVDGKDNQWFIDRAKRIFSAVRKNEIELYRQGIDLIGDDQWEYEFLYNSAETSIEIFLNGEGGLCYFLFMVGSLIVEFSDDALFIGAEGIPG